MCGTTGETYKYYLQLVSYHMYFCSLGWMKRKGYKNVLPEGVQYVLADSLRGYRATLDILFRLARMMSNQDIPH